MDKANFFNDIFTQQTTLNEANASLPHMPPQSRHSLSSIIITADEVQSTLISLSIGKATGPDSISNRLLKELAVPLSEPLADLFNFSIRSGKVPKLWKEANISPIYKKDDPSIVSNYRPNSLLNTLGKALEKNCSQTCFSIFAEIIALSQRYSLGLSRETLL